MKKDKKMVALQEYVSSAETEKYVKLFLSFFGFSGKVRAEDGTVIPYVSSVSEKLTVESLRKWATEDAPSWIGKFFSRMLFTDREFAYHKVGDTTKFALILAAWAGYSEKFCTTLCKHVMGKASWYAVAVELSGTHRDICSGYEDYYFSNFTDLIDTESTIVYTVGSKTCHRMGNSLIADESGEEFALENLYNAKLLSQVDDN